MQRYLCLHGHFYQPPRENPWLEEVELQDSAHPYHDWNERITIECYSPNAASRILDRDGNIIDIVNNYAQMSFNFGPTLLSWLQRHIPDTYKMIISGDKISQKNFSGHGSAMAQVYNHIIMPLANSQDKRTQIIWGIEDFTHRFHREPEGMWLAETAVDLETLEIMSEYGIKFTVLSPYQAQSIRKIGSKEWFDVAGGKIDPKVPYFCRLPSGRSIAIFFYDGPVAKDVAFGGLLSNGENFAHRLLSTYSDISDEPQMMHIATDGETYGHHHHFGEMALSYGLYHISRNKLARITIYGEFLANFPPIYEVKIFENSSWSCFHGVDRWRGDCGCRIGAKSSWNQSWRGPLREAMDMLRDNLAKIYETQMSQYTLDPWRVRNGYIRVVLNRTEKNAEKFLAEYVRADLSREDQVKILKLLEAQRNAMLMYTSCGWFFDEISGIETLQVMQYAARAMQLARETAQVDLEPEYLKILERAPSNIAQYKNGAKVYEKFIKPSILTLPRVGAHYAVSSLFTEYPKNANIYAYAASSKIHERLEFGKQRVVIGSAEIKSFVTLEESVVSFAVLHFGDHNLIGGVRDLMDPEAFGKMHQQIKDAFVRNNISEIMHQIDYHFGNHNYSLWHLFKDEQRKILRQILDPIIQEIEAAFRQINEHHYPSIRVMKDMGFPLPKLFSSTMALILNADIEDVIGRETVDFSRLENIVRELQQWPFASEKDMLGYVVSEKIGQLMKKLQSQAEDVSIMTTLLELFRVLKPLDLNLSLWKAQNIHFALSKTFFSIMKEKAEKEDSLAKDWVRRFNLLGEQLKVKSI